MAYHYRSLNQVNLIGRIGKAPVLRAMQSGGNALSFSVCTEISRKDPAKGWVQVPTWHSCVMYGTQADMAAKVLDAGALVSLIGRIVYSDKEKNGVKVRYTDIAVESFQLLLSKADARQPASRRSDAAEQPPQAQPASRQVKQSSSAEAAAEQAPQPEDDLYF